MSKPFTKKPATATSPTMNAASAPTASAMPRLNGITPQSAAPTRGVQNSPSPSKPKTFSRDEIARAAYFRWQRHGGDPVSNWVEAERELRARG
jgi:hypothetical protein